MLINRLFILLCVCVVCACTSNSIPGNAQNVYRSEPLTDAYTISLSSVSANTDKQSDFITVCIKRYVGKSQAYSAGFVIVLPNPHSQYYQTVKGKELLEAMFYRRDGQLILNESALKVTRGSCVTGSHVFEAYALPFRENVNIPLRGNSALYHVYKDDSLMALGFVSKKPFSNNEFSYAVDLSKTEVFTVRVDSSVVSAKDAMQNENITVPESRDFSIMNVFTGAAGKLLVTPILLIECANAACVR